MDFLLFAIKQIRQFLGDEKIVSFHVCANFLYSEGTILSIVFLARWLMTDFIIFTLCAVMDSLYQCSIN